MSKKLTLNIDDELISFAHLYSRQNRVSISKLVEHYFFRLKTANKIENLNPKTMALYGSFQDAPIPDKKELRKSFYEENSN